MNPVRRILRQSRCRDKELGIIMQNKSVDHIIRQFKFCPTTKMSVIRDHLYLTFGPHVRVNTDRDELTAEVDSVNLVIRRKENQVVVKVDGEPVASVPV